MKKTISYFVILGMCYIINPQVAFDSSVQFVDSGQSLGSSSSEKVALGDLDGDGDLDAFVGNAFGTWANKVWLNDGMGNFSNTGQNLGSSPTNGVALGDLDGDGDLDAFVGNGGANKVWLNDGAGAFTDSGQSLGSLDTRQGVALGDLDGDGDLDAFVGNSGFEVGEANKVWLNDGMGNFTDTGQNLGSLACGAVALGDLDDDDDLDAFVANLSNQPNKVWLNDGIGNFSDTGQNLGSLYSQGVALGDLDGDGDLDAFVGNFVYPKKVWLNDGAGAFTDSGQSLGTLKTWGVALGDLDVDGDLDAFVANEDDQPNKVWQNDGTGAFTDSGQSLGNSYSTDIALGDLDGDGDLDAFTANRAPNKVWLNQTYTGDFWFTVTADNRPNREIPGAFQQVLSQITQIVGDEGEFHISAGDIDPPLYTYNDLKSEFGSNVKWYPVVGNHETDDNVYMQWLRQYYDDHLQGTVNPGPTNGVKTTYSWDYGNAHFIVLNEYFDGTIEDGVGDVSDALFGWLSDDLDSTTQPAIFVFGHEPAFPQNRHIGGSLDRNPPHRDRFWNLLESKGVMAYICGHTHWYSRYQKPGGQVWQVDVGAAGVSYGTDGYLTFLDVGVSDNYVQFSVWRGTVTSPFDLHQSWTVIKNQTISTTENFEDCGTIIAGPNVTITSTGDVTLEYGERVILRNGFSIEDGGRLTVALNPCTLPLP